MNTKMKYIIWFVMVFALFSMARAETCTGEYSKWLKHGQPIQVGSHTIEVFEAGYDSDYCQFYYDGALSTVNTGSKKEFPDYTVKVTDAIAVYTKGWEIQEDYKCSILIGSEISVTLTKNSSSFIAGPHTIALVGVSDTGMCGFDVDGVAKWVDRGTEELFSDLGIRVLDSEAYSNVISRTNAEDTCELEIIPCECDTGRDCGLPDPAISDITTIPSNPKVGDLVTFKATVKNYGTKAVTEFGSTYWSVSGPGAVFMNGSLDDNIPPGGYGYLASTWKITKSGTYKANFEIDVYNEIKELNENNNRMSEEFDIGGTVHILATDSSSPSSDVLLIRDIQDKFSDIDFMTKLNLEFTRSMLDNRVTVFAYNNRVLIVVGEHSPTSDVLLAVKISSYLKERGITAVTKTSNEITSDDLRKAFDTDEECSSDSDCTVYFSTCSCSYVCAGQADIPRMSCARACPSDGHYDVPSCGCVDGRCAEKTSDFELKVSTDRTYYSPGESAQITVSVESTGDSGNPDVTATVIGPFGRTKSVPLEKQDCVSSTCAYPLNSAAEDHASACKEKRICSYLGKYYIEQPASSDSSAVSEASVSVGSSESVSVSKLGYTVKAKATLGGVTQSAETSFGVYYNNGKRYVKLGEAFTMKQNDVVYIVDNSYMKFSDLTTIMVTCTMPDCPVERRGSVKISYQGRENTVTIEEGIRFTSFNVEVEVEQIGMNEARFTVRKAAEKKGDVHILMDKSYAAGEKIKVTMKNDGDEEISYQAGCYVPYTIEAYTDGEWETVSMEDPCAGKCLGISIETLSPGDSVSLGEWNQVIYPSTCDGRKSWKASPGRYRATASYFYSGDMRMATASAEFEIADKASLECSGCPSGNSCLPYGTRRVDGQNPVYCSIESAWKSQLQESAACQNSYECLTNTCSNGKCIDLEGKINENTSLLQKIYTWLKNIFK